MSAADITAQLDRYRALAAAELRATLAGATETAPSAVPHPVPGAAPGPEAATDAAAELGGWLRYHLGWEDAAGRPLAESGGKLLRPAALLLAVELVGGDARACAPAAAAVELVHGFSLLHDDIEDRSETRRGRPTLWTRTGPAQAINAGDAMFVLARLAMHRLAGTHDPARVLRATEMLDEACWALVRGQYLDIAFESRAQVSPPEYLEMAAGKTAAMFAAPLAIGALLGGADAAVVRGFAAFGHHTGLAFQAIDDVLGIWGDTARTGKPVGDDLAARKMTYPVVAALAAPAAAEDGALAAAYADPAATVADLARLVEAAGGRAATEALARAERDAGLAALRAAGLPPAALAAAAAFADAAVLRVA